MKTQTSARHRAVLIVTFMSLLGLAWARPCEAGRTQYTSKIAYVAALEAAGYEVVHEGFEDDAAWGSVRSSIVGGSHTAPSITNLSVTWTGNNPVSQVTTGIGAVWAGEWGFFVTPHGENGDGINDGWIATHAERFYGFGGWIDTNTPYAAIIFVLDGDELDIVDFENTPVTTLHQFYGVIDTDGFTSAEVREIEGAGDDGKLIFADDFRFGVVPTSCTDLDGDDYGNPASAACVFPEQDCDDGDAAVNPGAAEIPGNGIDDDCNPLTPVGCQGEQ